MPFRSLLLSLLIPVSAEAQVSADGFLFRIQDHRANVAEIALATFHQFPLFFNHLDESLVRRYFLLHDGPKIYDPETLRGLGYQQIDSLFQRLLPFYGSARNMLSHDRRNELDQVIDELNRLEAKDKDLHFFELLSSARRLRVREQMGILELVADVTDTRLSPLRRQELAIPEGAVGPADWLRLVRENPHAAVFASWAEANYIRILAASAGRFRGAFPTGLEPHMKLGTSAASTWSRSAATAKEPATTCQDLFRRAPEQPR